MSFEQIRLGEVIKHRKGFITIDDSKEYKLCRVQLHRRGVVLREVVKGSAIRTKKQQVCKAGDFLVAEMDAKVGGYGFVPTELDGAIVSSHYFLFELDESKIRPKYLEVISQLQILQDQIKAVGSTNYAAIRPANVLNWNIPITNINKQKEIEILFDSTRAIGNKLSNEFINQQDLLTQLRQSFLREAMEGKLVKQDPKDGHAKDLLEKIKAEKAKSGKKEKELPPIKPEEIPFEIPENWVWCRLKEACLQIVDCPHSTPKYLTEETGYYGIDTTCIDDYGNITRLRNLSKEGYENRIARLTPTYNDIVYAREGSIGLAAFIPNNKRICLGQRVMLFRCSSGIIPEFLKMVVTEARYKDRLLEKHRGMGAKHVNVKDIVSSLIPLPPKSEQARIVRKMTELMRLCDELQKSIQASREQNELLLQQVLKELLSNSTT